MPTAAGCLFIDTKTKKTITGLQEKNGKMILSGFGGMIEPTDECVIDAAIRETLEELFHIQPVPNEVVKYIMINYIPRNQFQNGDYHVLVYDFLDLADFCQICHGFQLTSPLYDTFPKNLSELILDRKILAEAEVKQLVVLPFVTDLELCKNFQSDLKLFSQL